MLRRMSPPCSFSIHSHQIAAQAVLVWQKQARKVRGRIVRVASSVSVDFTKKMPDYAHGTDRDMRSNSS